MTVASNIIWFRNDLRVEDNDALAASLSSGGPVVPVFVWPSEIPEWQLSERRGNWLSVSLDHLDRELRARGSRLVLRRGDPAEALLALVEETGATAVYINHRYDPFGRREDDRVEKLLDKRGVTLVRTNGSLLFDPELIRNASGEPYRVFTPFWKRLLADAGPTGPARVERRIPGPSSWPSSDTWHRSRDGYPLDGLQPGEHGAMQRFTEFREHAIDKYGESRDRPDLAFTSRLSVHLAFGEISPKRIWHELFAEKARRRRDVMPFLRQLAWREFAYYQLINRPDSIDTPWRKDFASWPWRDDPEGLERWKAGTTGYPFVDANMRALAATGFMHNRGRLVTASFLTKHMMVSWLAGARWFWQNLLDADLANNTFGWQWTAGCGADAAPYFRVFNPVLQGERFDPNGSFVRRWVPELDALPSRFIHRPWAAPDGLLRDAGIRLGDHYPERLLDLAAARQRALDTFQRVTRSGPQ